jgi:nucleoside-diphosphate-sugar epimerase
MSKGSNWSGFDFAELAGTRALVTGGAGFIGSHLAIALDSIGVSVVVLDDLSAGGDPAVLPATVKFVKGSILDQALVEQCTAGCRYVFHQAALGSVPRSVEKPRLFNEVNVTGTLNVLEAARIANVRRVMFAASSSAYGDSETLPKIETMPAHPCSPYAANKVACEAMLSAYAASYAIEPSPGKFGPFDAVSLRYFNIFGPRQSPDNAYAAVIAAFAKALIKGQPPQIYGDGEQSRDFTYIDNVVLANLLAARAEKPLMGRVFNVACGNRISVTQLAHDMAELLGRPDLKPQYHPPRAGDVKHSLADLSAISKQLGYKPIVDFRDGLATTLKWYASVLPRV